jgi:hypothetical protein
MPVELSSEEAKQNRANADSDVKGIVCGFLTKAASLFLSFVSAAREWMMQEGGR